MINNSCSTSANVYVPLATAQHGIVNNSGSPSMKIYVHLASVQHGTVNNSGAPSVKVYVPLATACSVAMGHRQKTGFIMSVRTRDECQLIRQSHRRSSDR